jgi:hypothetical protein
MGTQKDNFQGFWNNIRPTQMDFQRRILQRAFFAGGYALMCDVIDAVNEGRLEEFMAALKDEYQRWMKDVDEDRD